MSLLAFHLFPMALVVAGCLPLSAGHAFRPLDVLGAFITIAAVLIESVANELLSPYRRSGAGGFCNVGL